MANQIYILTSISEFTVHMVHLHSSVICKQLNSYISTNAWESLRRDVTVHAYNYTSSCDSNTRNNFKTFVWDVIAPLLD